MAELSIEIAGMNDAAYLLDAIERYFAYDGILFEREKVTKGLRLLLEHREIGRAWVVRSQGREIGYAIAGFGFDLEFGGRQATLTDLFIEPSFRRKGLGLAILQRVEKDCKELGVHAIELQVETDNLEAMGLYEKFGFIRHNRIPMSKRLI
jgi:ribosomal protein S18 acetylase RimI-like enzyme